MRRPSPPVGTFARIGYVRYRTQVWRGIARGTLRVTDIFAIIPVEICRDHRLTLQQMRVLCTLLTFRAKNTDIVWPSRQQLADRCGMLPHKISEATTGLERLGWLTKVGKGGFSKSTRYSISVPDLSGTTVPEQGTVPESGTRPVPDSGTRKELTNRTDKDISTRARETFDLSCLPSDLSPAVWQDFVKHRRGKKSPINTQTVVNSIAKELLKAKAAGWPPDKALEEAMAAGWTGVKAEWLQNRVSGGINAKNQHDNRSRAQRHSDKLDEIARASFERERASGSLDCGDLQENASPLHAQVD